MRANSQNFKLLAPPIGKSVLLSTLALNLLALALPLVVLQVFDRVIPFQASETLFLLFLGLCIVTIFEFVLKIARVSLLGSTGRFFEHELSQVFIGSILTAEPNTFSKTTPATYLDQFGAIAQLRSFYSGQGRILAIDLPFTIVFVVMIGLIGGWLVIVPIGCALLLFAFRSLLQTAQSSIFERRRVLDSRRYSFLAEALSQIRTLKANTMEAQILRRYELLQNQTTEISHRIIKFSGMSQSFGALFSQFAVAALGLFGSYLVVIGHIGVAELAACMLLNGRTVQPMLKALGLWVQSENIAVAKVKYESACRVKPLPLTHYHRLNVHGDVDFSSVGFASRGTGDFVFRDVNGAIAAGETMMISGSSDEARTTLMRTVLGEVSPTSGRVTIDGKPASRFIGSRGQNGIIFVDQHVAAFAGTVLDNISAFGDGDRIERALELSAMLGVEKYIQRLPLGYNSQILGSRALTNNHLAMQGICLVRALALMPRVLLVNGLGGAMDEAGKVAFGRVISKMQGNTTVLVADERDWLTNLDAKRLTLPHSSSQTLLAWQADLLAENKENPASRLEKWRVVG